MNSVAADFFISDIDRERFGFKAARVNGITADTLADVLNFCAGEKVELLIARCCMSDLVAAQAMEKKGFQLMDTLVYYTRDLTRQPIPSDSGVAHFRPVLKEEEGEVISVAKASFEDYFGHYHADPRLDNLQCNEVYIDWARKAFASRGADENFLVAEIGGKIVAFGVFRMNSPDEGELFLGGVHPDYQGQGIYLSFLCRAIEWCLSKKAKRIVISTQLNNIAVQKVLTKSGFEISRGYYTFHKWFD
ncbi:MAG: GNAT family N-acetyltransferase [Smithella sp.]